MTRSILKCTGKRSLSSQKNRLISKLSSINTGFHIDRLPVYNMSYTKDMMLLCSSTGALCKLMHVCHLSAAAHRLRYNVLKSEFMIVKT